jgi:hypothetical protein
MNILEAMVGGQNRAAVSGLGQHLGLKEEQVDSALSVLVPALAAGFQRNMSSPQGLDGLLSALTAGQHQRYVDNPNVLMRAETTADGNAILGHVFGSKEVSREVASRAAAETGIGEGVLKSMLPTVAAMMMGAMSQRTRQPAAQGGAGGDALLSMLTPMLDSNRSGSAVDEVVGMIGKLFSSRGTV